MYEVLGKLHLSGTSKKTGRPYDLNLLFIAFDSGRAGVVGRECDKYPCSPELYNLVNPGDVFNTMLFDGRGQVCELR